MNHERRFMIHDLTPSPKLPGTGKIYISETYEGKRVQKFVDKGPRPAVLPAVP